MNTDTKSSASSPTILGDGTKPNITCYATASSAFADPMPASAAATKSDPGMRVRARAEINLDDQQKGTFYWCIQCCEAMARASHDAGESLEHRYAMGQKKAGSIPWDA